MAVGQLLGIGRLLEVEILNPSTGKTTRRKVSGCWLAWEPGKRRFHVAKVKGNAGKRVNGSVAKAHKRFHAAAPGGSYSVEVPEAAGRLRDLGLLKALQYDVPNSLRSPEKNPHIWHHAFGDTGHKGGDSYPAKLMPALKVNARGELFIVRRPGNIFRVDTWLRG